MRKNRFFVVKYFIGIWVISLFALWILPIQSKLGNEFESIMLISAFVIIVSASAVFWYLGTRRIKFKSRNPKEISIRKIKFIVYWSTVSTIIGNLFVYIDRVYFRGIDYSRGFRNARYQWNASTIPGSIISVMENLMIPFSYCALFMGVFHWEVLNKRQRFIAIIAGFGGQFGIAMLNGGRSNILLSIIFAFVICILRKYIGKTFLPRFQGRALWGALGLTVILSYVAAIMYAFTGNDLKYLHLTADFLGAKVISDYQGNPVINMITEMVLYMLHGIYYVSAVISNNPGVADINHNMSFRWIFVMLARTPLLRSYEMKLPDFDGGGGNFVALPGILLYDYGYFGFFIASIIFGIMFGATLKFLNSNRNNYGLTELIIVLFVLIHLYMSMITMALSFGYFMFMIFAMVSMELIAGLKYGKSGWVKVKS